MRKQNWYKLEQKAKKDLGLLWAEKNGKVVTYTRRDGSCVSVQYLNTDPKNASLHDNGKSVLKAQKYTKYTSWKNLSVRKAV